MNANKGNLSFFYNQPLCSPRLGYFFNAYLKK
nr:MAG TPA: hypothetical protein [Caudoviricetes sp.]